MCLRLSWQESLDCRTDCQLSSSFFSRTAQFSAAFPGESSLLPPTLALDQDLDSLKVLEFLLFIVLKVCFQILHQTLAVVLCAPFTEVTVKAHIDFKGNTQFKPHFQ